MSEARTAIDIIEEIAGVGAWTNRGSGWCSSCGMWVDAYQKYREDWHRTCPGCGGYVPEDNAERYEKVACDFFGVERPGDRATGDNYVRLATIEPPAQHPTGDTEP